MNLITKVICIRKYLFKNPEMFCYLIELVPSIKKTCDKKKSVSSFTIVHTTSLRNKTVQKNKMGF
jgi:hypothetical protein